MDKTIKWGVLAPGNIARRFVADLKTVDGAEVLAAGSRDLARATSFAADFEIPRAYGSYQELVSDPDVDVVYVCSPHVLHYEHSMLALEHGKGVLVEKPFALNSVQAEEMAELARKKGLFLMEALWTRCQPVSVELTRRIAEGAIGDVRMINATLGPIGTFPGKRSLNYSLGGGALLETGVYPISLVSQLVPQLGEPDEVRAWATITDLGIDEATSIVMSYQGGAVATLGTSFVSGVPNTLPSRAFVSGSAGWVDIPTDIHRPKEFTLFRAGAEPERFALEHEGHGYTYEAAEVVRCLRAGEVESPIVSVESSLITMRVLDRIRAQIGLVYPAEREPNADDD